MRHFKTMLRAIGVVVGVTLAACAGPRTATPALPSPVPTAPPPTAEASPAGLANPASVHCQDEGGRLELVTIPDGQVGVCVFADGSLCEEWAYFRDECQPGQFLPFTIGLEPGLENPSDQRCLEGGGQLALLRLSVATEGGSAEYGLCVWPTGKLCEQSVAARGECEP